MEFRIESDWFFPQLAIRTLVLFAACSLPLEAWSQSRFHTTSTRGGAVGAKQVAQIKKLYAENEERLSENVAQDTSITVNAGAIDSASATIFSSTQCGNVGQIFGPGHAKSVGDCVSSFIANADGTVTFSSGAVFGNASLCDPTTEGALRYSSAVKRFEFCDGSSWQGMGTGTACDFNFPDIADADPNTIYDSASAVYSGDAATASLSGGAGSIKKNGSNTGNSTGVVIYPGNTVGIRGNASGQFNQVTSFTLDIGSYSGCWKITTRQQDATPDAFVLNALTGQEVDTLVTSNLVTLTGFDGPLTASVNGSGAQLQVSGGAWEASASINPGQGLKLRMITSANPDTEQAAAVVVGAYSTTWSVRTETYDWYASLWGSCSATCGGGTQTRTIDCRGVNSHTVSSNTAWCSGTGPSTSQSCNTQSCCCRAYVGGPCVASACLVGGGLWRRIGSGGGCGDDPACNSNGSEAGGHQSDFPCGVCY